MRVLLDTKEILTMSFHFSRPKSSIMKRLTKAPIFLDIRLCLSFHADVGIPTNHSTSIQEVTHEKTPQNVYALLLIGIVCPVGSSNLFYIKPNTSRDEDGKPWVFEISSCCLFTCIHREKTAGLPRATSLMWQKRRPGRQGVNAVRASGDIKSLRE